MEDLELASARIVPGPLCGVARAILSVPEAERDTVREIIARITTIRASVVERYFEETYRIRLGEQSIVKHRAGKCSCRARSIS